MEVYRIEHEKGGHGPYFCNPDMPYQESTRRRPSPDRDGLDQREFMGFQDGRFGFSSEDQLRQWFGAKLLRLLHSKGYVCKLYEVPQRATMSGHKQLAFDRAAAEPKKKLSLHTIARRCWDTDDLED